MPDNPNLALWIIIWTIVIAIVVVDRWRKRTVGVGLSFVFLLNLWLIHWPAAVIYLLPWYLDYDIDDQLSLVQAGFEQSTYAVIGFGLGSVILVPLMRRLFRFPGLAISTRFSEWRLDKIYLVIGVICFIAKFSSIGGIRTIGALISAGWSFLVAGLCLSCWRAWQENRRRAFLGWLAVGLSFPFVTIVIMGFLGFGVWLFFSLFTFIASFVRPRWKLIVAALLLAYLGLSLYGTYARDRAIIRDIVWAQQAPLADRISQLYLTVSTLEWFNPFNPIHLYFIDLRLNMNPLEGRAVEYLGSGNVEYAGGATLWWSIIGMIPRAVWLNKPEIGGSGDFVSRYTGIEFAEGTSVAPGLVMEFYVNFGTAGVILGFLCFGLIVAALDVVSGQRLFAGDWRGFVLWFLPGLALGRPDTSLVEVTTSAGAAVVMVLVVNTYLMLRIRRKSRLAARGGPRRSIQSVQATFHREF